MIINNGNIFGIDEEFKKGSIAIQDGKIVEISYDGKDIVSDDTEGIIDAKGMYVVPGFVDIHFHGCKGYDLCDATIEALEEILKYQLSIGVTDIVPATMTLPKDKLEKIVSVAAKASNHNGSNLQGITMEGPFVSKEKKGAQNEAYIQKPDVEFFREIQEKSGNLIKQIVIAPEEDENYEFIKEISKETVVSIGHTMADYEMAHKAFENGATHVTHLFNGMKEFGHRQPNVVGAALDREDVYVELICDGVHVHPAMVRASFWLFGANRVCMISDSIRAAGMEDGTYTLGGQLVNVKENIATLEDGTIAGSVANLYECFKMVVEKMNIPLKNAILSCTKTPAKSLGIDNKCGILTEGRNADLLILDKHLNLVYILKNGKIYKR